MAYLFSRSFHSLWLPCPNNLLPPKLSEKPRISLPKPCLNFTHLIPNATSPSNSAPEDFDILSSIEHSDGSFVFRFAHASEVRAKIAELEKEKEKEKLAREAAEKLNAEDDRNLEEEIESSSVVAVDQNPQHLPNEKETVVLDSDSETPVIDHSVQIDAHLKLDSVDDGEPGISTEDVAAEFNAVTSVSEEESNRYHREEVVVSTVIPESDVVSDLNSGSASVEVEEEEEGGIVAAELNGVASASEEDSELDSLQEVAVATVAPESDVLSDLNIDAWEEVEEEEEADTGDGVDGATNNLTGAVDSDSRELVPESASLESEQDGYKATEYLTGAGDADSSELVSESTSLETLQDDYNATNGLIGAFDADSSELMPESTSLDSNEEASEATTDLIGAVDADLSEYIPGSPSLESELVPNDEETTQLIVDDSIDASKMEKSEVLHGLVSPSDVENNIDDGNTERNDYENTSHPTMPRIHSVETTSHEERTSRTEVFLLSGATCLPHPAKALTGREDAYFISPQNWLAVADGVSQWSLEGSSGGLYIRELMGKCENIVSNFENISTIKPAEVISRSAAETQSPGSSTVLVAHFDGQVLWAANVGNTGFIIIRDGSILKKSTPMFHEFNFPVQMVKGDDPSDLIEGYVIDLHGGDVIVTATNGLFDNLYEQEIASIISKSLQSNLTPQEIAEVLAMRAQEVGRSTSTRSPFADAAQAVGYVGYTGGKLDNVTVIVSLVQTT